MPPVAESFADLRFPTSGVDQTAAYQSQRPGTTRIGANVRGFEPLSQRLRGGQRQGLSQYVPQQLPTAARVQNLNAVVSVSGAALPWSFDYSYLNLVDPSSPGSATDWGPGKTSRVPPLLIPNGGWPYQPNKNLPRPVKIVWTRPRDILAGTALSGTQLNAQAQDATTGAAISGSFTYSPASGVVLPVGQAEALAATFTAADPSSYQTGVVAGNLINVVSATFNKINRRQTKTAASLADPLTHHQTFASNVLKGSLIVACFACSNGVSGSGNDVTGVSDNLGNSYTRIGSASATNANTPAGTVRVSVWVAVTGSAGTLQVAYTTSGTGRSGYIGVEYTNQKPGGAIDGTNSTSGGATSPLSAGSVSVGQFGEVGAAVFGSPQSGQVWTSAGDAYGLPASIGGGNGDPGMAYADTAGSVTNQTLPLGSTAPDAATDTPQVYGAVGFTIQPGP